MWHSAAAADGWLEPVGRIAALQHLELNLPGVGDGGLRQLERLTDLRELNLKGTKVTADGVKKLAAALPRCRIQWDGGVIAPTKK